MNYINILLAKINHFNSKMADLNYLDIRSLYHSNYLSTKYYIRFSPTLYYVNVPRYYTWNKKSWSTRKQGTDVERFPDVKEAHILGRVYIIDDQVQNKNQNAICVEYNAYKYSGALWCLKIFIYLYASKGCSSH